MSRRLAVAILCFALLPVAAEQRRPRTSTPPANAASDGSQRKPLPQPTRAGEPFRGLDASLRARFETGLAEFKRLRNAATGLGPVFNGPSCAHCHSDPVIGGSGLITNTRFAHIVNGHYDNLTSHGGQLLQGQAIGPAQGSPRQFRPEAVPAGANILAFRTPPFIFGLGLVDATPDATFIALAAEQAARRDGTAGRVAMVDNHAAGMQTMGKFGWKADVPTLHQFAGDAYLNEMSVTSPEFPDEICPRGKCGELQYNPAPGLNATTEEVRSLADFMTMLAPMPRGPITAAVREGEIVFNTIGCNACHVSTLQTGPHPIPALDRVTYHPYSDFLLHDMGFLGDGIVQGNATAREARTAPLWGLRMRREYLHDGRAVLYEKAIEEHDGQGRFARDRFKRLSEIDRAKLRAFLDSL